MSSDRHRGDRFEVPLPSSATGGWLRIFGRVTSGGLFLPWIDGLRFVAIAAVLAYHLNGFVLTKATGFTEEDARKCDLFHWCNGANCGVQIFFAISGFILALPFAREANGKRQIELRDYFQRRLSRLEPPFLINLAIATMLLIVIKQERWSELWPHLLATMTYTHNLIFGEHSRINGVAWSLEIEVQFYVVAPFLLRPYFQTSVPKRRICAMGLGLVLIATRILNPVNGAMELRLGLLHAFEHFLAGILVADVFVYNWGEQAEEQGRWDFVALIAFPLTFWSQRLECGRALLPLFSGLLLMSAIRGTLTKRILSTRSLTIIGGMCYTIYLYHFYMVSALGRFTLALTANQPYVWQLTAQVLLLFPPIVLCCAILFVSFERPFMIWKPFSRRQAV